MELAVGTTFDTSFESGCVVTSALESFGKASSFLALDSDGVECQFSTAMVLGHPDYTPLP